MSKVHSDFIEPTDYVQNLNKWSGDNQNILYITGVSGSGKTRLADELRKEYNCKVVNLDDLCSYYMEKADKFESFKVKHYNTLLISCPEAIEFIDNNKCIDFGVRDSYENTLDIVLLFLEDFEKRCYSNGELYIVEGYLLHRTVTPDWFKNKPLIIKIIDYETVVLRRLGRQHGDNLSEVTERELEISIKNSRYKESYDSYIKFRDSLK